MKKLLSLVLSLALALSLAVTAAAQSAYSDTADPAAAKAAELGLMNGVGGGRFAPDAPMTRAMLVTTLGRLAGVDPSDYASDSPLTDVTATWCAPYALWAWQDGIVRADGTLLAPDAAVTQAELEAVLARYSGDFTDRPETEPSAPLTRLECAKALVAFAQTKPAAPVSLRSVMLKNGEGSALTDNDRYSMTETVNGAFDCRYDVIGGESPRASVTFANGSVSYYGDGGIFLKDPEFGPSPVCFPPELYESSVDDLLTKGFCVYDAGEYLLRVERSGGELTITTRGHTDEQGVWAEFTYRVDAATERVDRIDVTYFDAVGEKLGEQTSELVRGEAEVDGSFVKDIPSLAPGAPTRTLTLVLDPDAENERSASLTRPDGTPVYYMIPAGYAEYLDRACTVPKVESFSFNGDATVYLAPITQD